MNKTKQLIPTLYCLEQGIVDKNFAIDYIKDIYKRDLNNYIMSAFLFGMSAGIGVTLLGIYFAKL